MAALSLLQLASRLQFCVLHDQDAGSGKTQQHKMAYFGTIQALVLKDRETAESCQSLNIFYISKGQRLQPTVHVRVFLDWVTQEGWGIKKPISQKD